MEMTRNEEIMVLVTIALMGGVIFLVVRNNTGNTINNITTAPAVTGSTTTSTTPAAPTTAAPTSATTVAPSGVTVPTTVGSTNIAAPAHYYDILDSQVEGNSDNIGGALVPLSGVSYYDGGINMSDVPVETLTSGQQAQFFIYSGYYPESLSKSNIFDSLSINNTANGWAWAGEVDSCGAIYCNVVGSQDVYPMSLDTAEAIGMKQDITDLLFVDHEYMGQFNTPITAVYENGWYALSPVNPTVNANNIQNGSTIVASGPITATPVATGPGHRPGPR